MRTRSMLIWLTLALSTPAWNQTTQPLNPTDSLEQARSQLLADIIRQSRYTCVQNITRRFYESDSRTAPSCDDIVGTDASRNHSAKLAWIDRLQLDVAIADSREIHAWPGATKFSEEEIRELAGSGGPFGSGDFAAFIAGIFGGSATIKFEQTHVLNRRTLNEYAFEVPQTASHYAIATPVGTITTGYSGSFLLDPETSDLAELTVRTAELPFANACQAISAIRYQKASIHGQDVLMPSKTELRAIFRDGTEAIGVTSYSSCHEYASDTKLRFDVEDVAAKTIEPRATSTSPTKSLPQGLTFQCRIVTPLDSETSAGRMIEAVLRAPLVDQYGQTLAPVGARIHGRLVRFVEYKRPHNYFEADIRLDTIEINGVDVPLFAILVQPAEPPAGVEDFSAMAPRNVGAFYFPQKHLNVQQWDSMWLATMPEPTSTEK
jgi:hypothetical protein